MEREDLYEMWGRDGEVVAEIGRALFPQALRVEVRLPRRLAAHAQHSWEREDGDEPLPEESSSEHLARGRAATLALIGLDLENQAGGRPDGDDVVVDLEAWSVGNALQAADDLGLLANLPLPQRTEVGDRGFPSLSRSDPRLVARPTPANITPSAVLEEILDPLMMGDLADQAVLVEMRRLSRESVLVDFGQPEVVYVITVEARPR